MSEATPEQSEFGLIRWIRERTQIAQGGPTVLGIGDDCAIVRPSRTEDLLITTDMLMDGRHFHLDEAGADAVGFKAIAVNVSDIAAMAGKPVAAVVAVALPRERAVDVAVGLHAGIADAAARFGLSLIGGDTNVWDGPLVVSVTVFGETTGRGAVRRSGARVGDIIFVSGPLGGSLIGRHLRPSLRVHEAIALNTAAPIHAMIDLSDGLASDLGHILAESGRLGAVLDESSIPIHLDAVAMSADDGRSPFDHALSDGEDFELCFVVSREDADRLEAAPPAPLWRIGEIVESPGIVLRGPSGITRALAVAGFDHMRE